MVSIHRAVNFDMQLTTEQGVNYFCQRRQYKQFLSVEKNCVRGLFGKWKKDSPDHSGAI